MTSFHPIYRNQRHRLEAMQDIMKIIMYASATQGGHKHLRIVPTVVCRYFEVILMDSAVGVQRRVGIVTQDAATCTAVVNDRAALQWRHQVDKTLRVCERVVRS